MPRLEATTMTARSLLPLVLALSVGASAADTTHDDEIGFAASAVCKPERIDVPAELRSPPPGAHDDLPVLIEADTIETEGENTVVLRGNARIVQGGRGVYAEQIVYHRDGRRARAVGDVVLYTSRGDEVRADALTMDVDTFVGEGAGVAVKIADSDTPATATATPTNNRTDKNTTVRARATAQGVQFEGGDFQRLANVSMTTCAEGNRDVVLSAREITLDHANGVGAAQSMTVRFKDTPIFYFPTATFPIDDRRKTGFLFPSAGYTGKSGWTLEAPYYINIAPQYDATLTPRLLSRRGAQLVGQFRYLSPDGRGRGAVRGEFLPSDNAFADQDRHALGYDHRHRFGDGWSAAVDLQTVSDSAYLRDFSGDIDVIASSYIARKARLEYAGAGLRFSARVAAYDSVNDAIVRSERPYASLPQLRLAVAPRQLGWLRAGVEAEYTNFQHDACGRSGGTSQRFVPCGARFRLTPTVSMPFTQPYGYVEPRLSLRAVRYSLDEHAPASDASPAVDVPIFSIDSGLFFERELQIKDTAYLQTLEPRLLYVNIPYKRRQRGFPDFDSDAGSDSSLSHFFRTNRFFGGDRIGDTEHYALGVSSRLVSGDTGRQRLKLSLGQVFYRQDRVLSLASDSSTQTQNTSGLLTEFTAALSARWDATGFAHWDEDTYRVAADYTHDRRHASFEYVFKDDDSTEQLNAAWASPLGARWRIEADAAYSFADDDIHSAALGFSFDGCCWAVRVVAQRYLDGVGEHKNRLLMTLELADLGGINSRL